MVRFEANKHLVRDAANIGLGHFVHLVELQEQLPPIAVARLVLRQRIGQPLVVGEAAQQVSPARVLYISSSASVTSVVFSLSISLRIASRIWSGVCPGTGTA